MSEKNKETVRKVNDAFLENNFEGFLDFCADDVQWTIVGDRSVNGKETIRQWMSEMAKENPEPPKFSVIDPVIAEGDFVAMQARGKSTTKTGKSYNNTYCQVFRIVNGKVQQVTEYLDTELVTAAFGK